MKQIPAGLPIEKQEERTVKKRKRYLALAAVLGASTLFAGCADGGRFYISAL